jgi:hypothetical protein
MFYYKNLRASQYMKIGHFIIQVRLKKIEVNLTWDKILGNLIKNPINFV